MGFYVPWVVDGSKHSARLFRRTLQQQVGTGSGVSRPGDLKVQALNVPGTGFRVAPGGGVAQSRDTAFASRESYGPILDAELVVPSVPGTGSGSGRRDLVILEITDPEMESVTYTAPSDPKGEGGWLDGANFCRITVISGVGAGVKSLDEITTGPYANVTGVTLAAINWPASTGTITNAMIEDLRRVQTPLAESRMLALGIEGTTRYVLTQSGSYPAGGETWPSIAEGTWGPVEIPEGATHAQVRMEWAGVYCPAGAEIYCEAWVQLGATSNPANLKTPLTAWYTNGETGINRTGVVAAAEIEIPTAMRGTAQVFLPRARQTGGATNAARPVLDRGSAMTLQVVFVSKAV